MGTVTKESLEDANAKAKKISEHRPYGIKRGAAHKGPIQKDSWTARLSLATLGVWIGVIAAVATPFYLLGVVILTAQISKTYNLSFATAWYAASLVPSIGILGISFGIVKDVWLIMLAETAFGLFLIRFDNIDRFQDMAFREYIRRYRPSFRNKYEIIATIATAFIVLIIVFSFIFSLKSTHDWIQSAVLTLSSIWYLLLMMVLAGRKSPRVRVLIVFAFLYAQVGLTTLTTKGIEVPRLPAVELNKDAGTKIQGQLLKHSDSYWYVLTHNPDSLVGIPDNTAQSVTAPPSTMPTSSPSKTPG